ncbi:LacI family DNA-binding transcriptional regulator [Spirochaeta africana]|uniref:Transcriptional regulator n=1 Tax=Spirochaeta africana (strain ATCC 700263 / DSM 8902 / Z-7692) TaxID=889378 RepID=H9UI90_SPIAZ|nr:LacI family DNA-binding transcriptional regulator [Spirochaeta africana]AFG37233.1 transcriptional regulator [Spirochaeta africana DSM 8902]
MKATINDVARISGYSKTSVSFAFNDPKRISPTARQKILSVADDLGYFPDPAARHLSMRRIGSVGFLTPHGVEASFLNPYIVEVFRGVSATMQAHGLTVTVVSMAQDVIVEAIRNAAVGGFISLGLQPEDAVRDLIVRRSIPFVTVDAGPLEGISSVNIRDRKAAETQMEMVLHDGHTNVGIVAFEEPTASEEATASDIYAQRIIGYTQALEAAGLPSAGSEQIPVVHASATIDGGYRAAKDLLARYPDMTAIVSMCDVATAGIYLACEELGLQIPRDISVAGFDDIPNNQSLRPSLTTISQPGFRKGETAAHVLLENMEDPESYVHRLLAYEIIHGQSVSAPRAR